MLGQSVHVLQGVVGNTLAKRHKHVRPPCVRGCMYMHWSAHVPGMCPLGVSVCLPSVCTSGVTCLPDVCVFRVSFYMACVLKVHVLWVCAWALGIHPLGELCVPCIHSSGICMLWVCVSQACVLPVYMCATRAYACSSGVYAPGMSTVVNSSMCVIVHACASHVCSSTCVYIRHMRVHMPYCMFVLVCTHMQRQYSLDPQVPEALWDCISHLQGKAGCTAPL